MSVKHYNKNTGKWEIFPGTIGAPGLSAYQSAVKLGYKGTEEEWIESLHGKDAYTTAVENGYRGTEEEYNLALAVIPSVVDKVENPDSEPTLESQNLISSNAVKVALTSLDDSNKVEFSRIDQSINAVNEKVNTLIDSGIKTQIDNSIVDNLESEDSNKSLSANQGRILKGMIDGLNSGIIKVVESLPEEGDENIIYLIKKAQSRTDLYEEYLWVNGAWELLGNTSIDITNYYTKEEIDTKTSNLNSKIESNTNNISDINTNGIKTKNSLKIQKNGADIVTFNGLEEKTANIEVPTKLSDLDVTDDDIIDVLGYTPANAESAGNGDVTGPSSSTENNIPLFGSTSGKILKDSGYNLNSFAAKNHTHNAAQITDLKDNLKTINGESIVGSGDISSEVVVLKLSTSEENTVENIEEFKKLLSSENKLVLALVDGNVGYFYKKSQKLEEDIYSVESIICSIIDNSILKYRANPDTGELTKFDEIDLNIVAAYKDSSIGINLNESYKNNNFIAQGGIIFPEDSNESRLGIINSYKLASLTQRRPCLINVNNVFFYGDLSVEGGYTYVEYNSSIHHITVLKINNTNGSVSTERVYDLDLFNTDSAIDLLSYGVEWDDTISDPHLTRIGNPLLHKSLPIQSAFKGCVANGGEVNYYLDVNDWSKKENGEPSVLDGTDGTVRVHTPKFYGKSGTRGSKHWVRVSEVQIDSSWVEIPEMLIDAYRCTVDTTVSETPKAVSVVNTTAAFRGGSNREDSDQYLESEVGKTDLGKPRTNLSRATFRTYAKNAGSELLCYEYYKWIFYWLYVIEYANFNCQESYNPELTPEGYHQGGLGQGVSNMTDWNSYNNTNPIVPCGYCNEFGNFTGIKELEVSNSSTTITLEVPRWRGFDSPFGDIWTNLDGILVQLDDSQEYSNVYTTTNSEDFGDGETQKGNMKVAGTKIHKDGYIKSFDLGERGEIIPLSVGATSTTYMCDYAWCGNKDTSLRTVLVGGRADIGSYSGLGYFHSADGVGCVWTNVGFRSLSLVTHW